MSILKYTRLAFALLFASVLASACSDGVGPAPRSNTAAVSATVAHAGKSSSTSGTKSRTGTPAASPDTVSVLRFNKGIGSGTSASAVIGPEGGYLVLRATGFTLFVPPGAVSVPTTFTVTPVGGDLVAYDFEPHGTTFAVPLVFMQDLSKTNFVAGKTTRGAYFADKSKIDAASGTAEVSELFTLSFDGFGLSFFSVEHFSGYLVSMA